MEGEQKTTDLILRDAPDGASILRDARLRRAPQDEENDYCRLDQSRLSRSRISLPVLKNGTLLRSTETWAPVRGLRPVRAGRCLTEKAPKPRSSTRSPRASALTISPRIALTMFSTSR